MTDEQAVAVDPLDCEAWAPAPVLEALSAKFNRPRFSANAKLYLKHEDKLVHRD